jgi:hypothetical protein
MAMMRRRRVIYSRQTPDLVCDLLALVGRVAEIAFIAIELQVMVDQDAELVRRIIEGTRLVNTASPDPGGQPGRTQRRRKKLLAR